MGILVRIRDGQIMQISSLQYGGIMSEGFSVKSISLPMDWQNEWNPNSMKMHIISIEQIEKEIMRARNQCWYPNPIKEGLDRLAMFNADDYEVIKARGYIPGMDSIPFFGLRRLSSNMDHTQILTNIGGC